MESDRNHNKTNFELFTLKIYTDMIRGCFERIYLEKNLAVGKNKSFSSLLLVTTNKLVI